jgi:hypothetical protein
MSPTARRLRGSPLLPLGSLRPTILWRLPASSSSLHTIWQKPPETGENPGNHPESVSLQVVLWKDFPLIGFQTIAMCKIGKLSFVAGAELPKRYALT